MRLSKRDPVAMYFKFSRARRVLEKAISYGQNTREPCSQLVLKSFLSDQSSAPQEHVFPPGINMRLHGISKFSNVFLQSQLSGLEKQRETRKRVLQLSVLIATSPERG